MQEFSNCWIRISAVRFLGRVGWRARFPFYVRTLLTFLSFHMHHLTLGAVSFSLVCSLLLLLLIQSSSSGSGCRCAAQSRVCWHVGWRLLWRHLDNKFVFNLALVHLDRLIHDALLPLIFEVEKDVFASHVSAACWIRLKGILLLVLKFQMHYGR